MYFFDFPKNHTSTTFRTLRIKLKNKNTQKSIFLGIFVKNIAPYIKKKSSFGAGRLFL
jgi:hypothetical protein